MLSEYVAELGGAVLQSARLKNPTRKIFITGMQPHPLTYVSTATGPSNVVNSLAFTYTFAVPPGGFRPPPGRKAFAMYKPETGKSNPIYRARIYNKKGGQNITRYGFFSRALEEEILSIKGKRRQQGMTDRLAAQVAQAVAEDIVAHLQGVEGIKSFTDVMGMFT